MAEIARARHPDHVVPAVLRSTVRAMGRVAQRIVAKAGCVVVSQNARSALGLERDDDAMDDLVEQLHRCLLDGTCETDTRTAMDLALVGRYYQRFADHAVSVARRVAFLPGESGLDCVPEKRTKATGLV